MKIILSCTSIYSRLDMFYYCVQSLLNQTLKPDLFLINVSKESFFKEGEIEEIPDWLKRDDITINWVEDTRSYRKLIPALDYADQEDLIITVDDDVLYSKTLVEDLVEQGKKHPDKIVCGRGRQMKKNIWGQWQNYANWKGVKKPTQGINIIPIGVGGVVYRKELLDMKFLKDENYLHIAKTTDDLWFKMASLRNKTDVLVQPNIDRKHYFILHNKGLSKKNWNLKRQNNFLFKAYSFLYKKIVNYLGVSQTPNDFNWDKIVKYSN